MTRKFLLLMLMLSMTLVMTGVAFAQVDDDDDTMLDDDDDTMMDDDDDTTMDDDDDSMDDDDDTAGDDDDFFNSTLEFDSPTVLEADKEYEFIFTVTNTAVEGTEKADWINQVDLTMPSQDYAVNESELTAPDPLYGNTGDDFEIDRWEVSFDPNTSTISWQCFGVVTSVNYGDIREGDFLSFQFVATTDSVPTGTVDSDVGFDWILYSDEGNMVTGTAFIGAETPGGDDDDDDTVDIGDDDDDSGGGGCGC
jgi:hypothetical protein